MKKILLILLTLLGGLQMNATTTGYKIPRKQILDIYNTPPFPLWSNVPYETALLEFEYEKNIDLKSLARKSVKLAGIELIKEINAPISNYHKTSLKIHDTKNDKTINVQLENGVKIRDYDISLSHKYLAFTYETKKGIKLAVITLATGKTEYVHDFYINDS